MNHKLLFSGVRVENGETVYGLPYSIDGEIADAIRPYQSFPPGRTASFTVFRVVPDSIREVTADASE